MSKTYVVSTTESEDRGELNNRTIFLSLKEAKEYLVEDGEEGTIYELVPVLTNIPKQKIKTVWRKL